MWFAFFLSNGVWIISRRVLRCHSVLHSIVLFNIIWCLGHTPDRITLQVNRFCATMLNYISQNIMPITYTLVDCLRKVPIAYFPSQSHHPCIYILHKQDNDVSRMVSANPNMANISWCDFFQMHMCMTVFIRYTTANHSNGMRYHHFYFTVVIPRFEWARLYLNVAHNMLISWIYYKILWGLSIVVYHMINKIERTLDNPMYTYVYIKARFLLAPQKITAFRNNWLSRQGPK